MAASQNTGQSLGAGVDLAKRGRWLRPAVSRLSAGSAEDGVDTNPDGGQPS